MNNVSQISNCFGCGMCAVVCPKNIIGIALNKYGFYEPIITNIDKCINCGLCCSVCSFIDDKLSLSKSEINIRSYAAWSNDSSVLQKCSSGGVSYEVGKYLLSQGFNICCVRYNSTKNRAEHYIATTEVDLDCSVGSKYIQSYTLDAFRSINRKSKYLITGTPCQIDSFRRYIKKFNVENNFILMDFFCHSIPSMLAWRKYVKEVEKIVGPIISVSWRNKKNGWHNSYALSIKGASMNKGTSSEYYSNSFKDDVFYRLFFNDFCSNPACQYNCKYKYDCSSADVRIGDFWGQTYSRNESGVSALVSFTERGYDIIKHIDCSLTEHAFEIVAEGQMKKNVSKAYISPIIYPLLRSNISLNHLSYILWIETILRLPMRICRKLVKFMRS